MSTLAGPAVSVAVTLNTRQRESIIQRVSKVVEEYVWDPAFPRDRWREAVNAQRSALLKGVDAAEFEQGMDALVRQAGDLLSVRGRDMGFFHKSKRKTHPNRLASHFRYCQPNECSSALTRAAETAGGTTAAEAPTCTNLADRPEVQPEIAPVAT